MTIEPDRLEHLQQELARLEAQVHGTVLGQDTIVRMLLVTLFAGGHALLEGVPGLAKTLLVRTLASALHLSFKRIQFTPDLMPSDIIGTEVLEEDHTTGKRTFRFNRGPVFAHLVLADEINRSPPKTQSALLEAMQEREVTWAGESHSLPAPFLVLATQNPIEQAGTYPLPEAQLDRFLLHLRIDYPKPDDELRILAATTGTAAIRVEPVMTAATVREIQELVRDVHLSDGLLGWVGALLLATRPSSSRIEAVRNYVDWGAGPRAGQSLILAAKAAAFLDGRLAVTKADIESLAPAVLRHRILLNFRAQAERVTADTVAQEVIAGTARPPSPLR